MTSGVASAFHLSVGDSWRVGGVERRVVGIVENPQSLLDEFALVAPGQVTTPTQRHGAVRRAGRSRWARSEGRRCKRRRRSPSPTRSTPRRSRSPRSSSACCSSPSSPSAASPCSRSAACAPSACSSRSARPTATSVSSSAPTATVVGLVGAILGFVLGLVVWLAYRPSLEQSSHHVIGVARPPVGRRRRGDGARRPRGILRGVPSGAGDHQGADRRRAVGSPRAASSDPSLCDPRARLARHRLPLARLLRRHGQRERERRYARARCSGSCSSSLDSSCSHRSSSRSTARLGRRAPIATRLALRDLARYRARSGSALAAISLRRPRRGDRDARRLVPLRERPRLRGTEPRLERARPPRQHATAGRDGAVTARTADRPSRSADDEPPTTRRQLAANAAAIAKGLGAQLIALETPNAQLMGTNLGRNWNGQIYVATPQLLSAFGIKTSEINPNADVLSSRPGLSGVSGLDFNYGSGGKQPWSAGLVPELCTAATSCLAHPVIQEVGALPCGTSAPNTVITEHAMREFHIQASTSDWLVQGTAALHGRSDQQRGARRLDDAALGRVEERSAHVFRRDQLGDDLRDRDCPRRARHVGRSRAKRNCERSPHARGHRRLQFHPAHADRGDGWCARLPRSAPRDGWAATSACSGGSAAIR